MNQKKPIGFGFRGWMLILFQAIAYITFQVFTQYPLNILNGFYGGAQVVSQYYSISAVVGIFIQILLIGPISRLKSIKSLCIILGAVSLVLALGVMLIPGGTLWVICYCIINVTSVLYATVTLGLLIGQWFPTRKGSVMGIATLAFPIANGLLGPFASSIFGPMAIAQGAVNPYALITKAFLPFFIVSVVGWAIGLIFIKDYPEQVGAFRDNNRNMTPEAANAIMLEEIENKKTSVWTLGRCVKSRDFWFVTISNALLLGTAIGLMSQSQAIINNGGQGMPPYNTVMILIMIFGMIGSFVLGLIDNRIGTRKAIVISVILMIIAAIFGIIGKGGILMVAMIFVALFMGAASNFGLSSTAQYWRREDFGRVFMLASPIGSLISSIAPVVVARLTHRTILDANGAPQFTETGEILQEYLGPQGVFTMVLICGIVCLVCMIFFSPKHIKEQDDKYRAAAGKPLDDALVGRK